MHVQVRITPALVSAGVVHRVDTVNREVAVFVSGELLNFDVPVGCTVVLHGEPVKLRLVQPQDRVRIIHASRGSLLAALLMEVQPDAIASARLHKEESKHDAQTATRCPQSISKRLRSEWSGREAAARTFGVAGSG